LPVSLWVSSDHRLRRSVGAAGFLGGVEASEIHGIVFQWAHSVDAAEADAELAADGFNVFDTTHGLVPSSVSNLGEVRSLAPLVAGLIVVLGMVTVLYRPTGDRRRISRVVVRDCDGGVGGARGTARVQRSS